MSDRARRRQACIDRIVYFANHVLIEGWSVPPLRNASLRLSRGGLVLKTLAATGVGAVDRPDVAAALQGHPVEAGADMRLGYVAVFPVEACGELDVLGETYDWHIIADGGDVAAMRGMAEGVGRLGGEINPVALDCIRNAGQLALLPDGPAQLLEAALTGFDGIARLTSHFDAVAREGRGIAAEGWIANAGMQKLVFMTDDGLCAATSRDVMRCPRADVSPHLRAIGERVLTDEHGVLAVLAGTQESVRNLLVGSFRDGRITGYTTASAEPTADIARLLARINLVEGGGRFVTPEAAERLYRPFVYEKQPSLDYTVQTIREVPGKPDLSIIVPFYKEEMFVRHLTTMQMWFSSTVEWIFVCDDPSLRRSLETYLRRRAPLLRNTTKFVVNTQNYGYGRANNIGAQVAQGDYVLFMNSDIWVDDAGPLERAVLALDAGDFGAVGFRLLYEDGTVQHDGLAFQRHGDVNDLFLVEHPGKGLPPRPAALGEIAETPAVTGALLLVGRELFLKVGGFDDRYVRGDFEDADLCFRIAALGHRIGVVRDPGIYHLERQSIRLMGDVSFREIVMYLNCITFNRRWGEALGRAPARPAPARMSPLEAA